MTSEQSPDQMSFDEASREVTDQWLALRNHLDELTAIAVNYQQSGCKNKALGQRFRTTTCQIEKLMKGMRETTKLVTKLTPNKKRKLAAVEEDA